MVLLDANAILRYFLNDEQDRHDKAKEVISNNECAVRYEVFAEVVYVLKKFYNKTRREIAEKATELGRVETIKIQYPSVMATALRLYAETDLDFVDCILVAFNHVNGYSVFTFDKKMNALLR
jgi:predicted nucleic-acid-binding protein